MALKSDLFIDDSKIEWENAGEGLRRKVLGYDDKLMMVKVEFQKGAVGYLHKHTHTQVSYIISGKFEIQIGEEKQILKEGDCYFTPSNVEHGAVNIESGILIDVFTPVREDFLK